MELCRVMGEAMQDKVSPNMSSCNSGRRWFVGTDVYHRGGGGLCQSVE